MSGFANAVVGGMSKLIRAAIQSPNFVHNTSGWSINKDGTAEFQSAIIRGILTGSNVVFSNGVLSNGDGTYSNIPAFLLYSSTPAANNLILSVANGPGADVFGNSIFAGIVTFELGSPIKVLQIWNQIFQAYSNTVENGFFTNGDSLQVGQNQIVLSDPGVIGPLQSIEFVGGLGFVPWNGSAYETWQNPTLLNTWNGTLSYRMMAENLVWIFGLIKPGSLTPVTTVYNVPSAYQPRNGGGTVTTCNIPCIDSTATVIHNAAVDTTFRLAGTYAATTDNVVVNGFYPLLTP